MGDIAVEATGRLSVAKVAGALGAEVSGVDLAEPLDAVTLAAITAALDEHLVLFFPGQRLSPEQQLALTGCFGTALRVPYVEPMAGHPEVIAVKKTAAEKRISVFGGDWHSDFSFLEEPPSLTLLHAVSVPPWGGDTVFANMQAAYESLSEGLKARLDGMAAMHSGHVYGAARPPTGIAVSRSIGISRNNPDADVERAHPVVRRHPATGRKALFVNPIYTTRFAEMTEDESRPLLAFLYARATRPEFCCRYRWADGALAIWDNRATMHYAVNDYDGFNRLLHRTTVAGERPLGV